MPELTRATFERLLHQTLTATPFQGGASVALRLTAVEPLPGAKHPESFRLVFQGAKPLPQGTYAVEHPQLGQEAIFLVPIGRTEQGTQHEAIFNRG